MHYKHEDGVAVVLGIPWPREHFCFCCCVYVRQEHLLCPILRALCLLGRLWYRLHTGFQYHLLSSNSTRMNGAGHVYRYRQEVAEWLLRPPITELDRCKGTIDVDHLFRVKLPLVQPIVLSAVGEVS